MNIRAAETSTAGMEVFASHCLPRSRGKGLHKDQRLALAAISVGFLMITLDAFRIGGLEGLAGRFDAARQTIAAARALMDELGLRHLRAHSSDVVVFVEMLAGDYQAAEREASAAYAVLTEMGDRTYQGSEAHFMAMAMEAQGRVDDAERWLAIAGQPGQPDTIAVEAQIQARRGNLHDAERLARSALELGSERPVPQFADPRFTLAQILARMGRNEEARQVAEQSMQRYETKGIVPLVEKARALLATLPAKQ
jgi:tetratricopeptide (TPR) repeat protein